MGWRKAPIPPTFLLTLYMALAGGAAVCQAADGGSRQELWCWSPDASPGGAPTRPYLADVSRYLCLTPETLFQRKPTDHRLSLTLGILPRPRLKLHNSVPDSILIGCGPLWLRRAVFSMRPSEAQKWTHSCPGRYRKFAGAVARTCN